MNDTYKKLESFNGDEYFNIMAIACRATVMREGQGQQILMDIDANSSTIAHFVAAYILTVPDQYILLCAKTLERGQTILEIISQIVGKKIENENRSIRYHQTNSLVRFVKEGEDTLGAADVVIVDDFEDMNKDWFYDTVQPMMVVTNSSMICVNSV